MRRLPAHVPWSATSRSRAAPCCSGSSSQSSSLWPSWRAVEGDVAGASGGWVVAGAAVAGAGVGAGVGGAAAGGAAGRWAEVTVVQWAAGVAGARGRPLVTLVLLAAGARGPFDAER